MDKIKSYTQFINESNSNKIIDSILDSIEPTVLQMVNRVEKLFNKQFPDREYTRFDRDYARMNVISDLIKSIEKYTSPSDSLVSVNASTSSKGNIKISSIIMRDDIKYTLDTEAIIAGGWNIQMAHYRYITKTKLPKTGISELTKQYNAKLKKMTKIEKINNEINSYEARINTSIKGAEIASKLTDDDIWKLIIDEDPSSVWPSWDEITKRGADKNYDYNEDLFNSKRITAKERKVSSYKLYNVDGPRDHAIRLGAQVSKLKIKLEKELDII